MSGEKSVPEKTHSSLGASVASRWMACPGSVRLSAGLPNPTSAHAQEGTRAHALAELCLRRNLDASFFVGLEVEGGVVDEEMADFVQIYVDYCRSRMIDGLHLWWIEHRFNLGALNPPAPMFGTADFEVLAPEEGTLEVVDLKYGQGVVVEAKGNKQLRYYGLGAALSLGATADIREVKLTIVQPRAQHVDGVIRSETLSYAEIIEFAAELMAAAKATMAPNAPLAAGDHCRWCLAKAICPEQFAQSQAIAQTTFAAMPADVPPAPETLPPALLAEILTKLPILEEWMKAVRGHAYGLLEQGQPVEGFKLVQKRATRSWVDESETEQWLLAKGNKPEEISTKKLLSPAQIEKLVGKKKLPADLVKSVSSGLNMVPRHHAGQEVILTPGSEFGVLPTPTSSVQRGHNDDES